MAELRNDTFSLPAIQAALSQEKIDGWLLCDFRGNNSIARRVVNLGERIATRRWYYFIPAAGTPTAIVHAIESNTLDHLPGLKVIFRSWQDLRRVLAETLKGYAKVAMEYSPENDIPYVSLVDAGTVELVRGFGVNVVSSGDMVQFFEALWSDKQQQTHFEAARLIDQIKDQGFRFAAEKVESGERVTEYDVQQYMWDLFGKNNLTAEHAAIVAVNANASNPHYAPEKTNHSEIRKGDLLLIDIWGKLKIPGAIYADITWMGFMGNEVPARHQEIFDIVKSAQRKGFEVISENFRKQKSTYGWEADEAVRRYISEKGYGDYFLHRTGHSIGQEVHGNGAHLDNLETKEGRKLLQYSGFSIEPGIYLPEFGVRSEIDVFIGPDGPIITSPEQTHITPLLK